MKKIIFGALVAMILAACVKEDASIVKKIEEPKNPYAVTPDEAVQLLKSVMGGESTRAVSVGEIKTLRKSDFVPTTRGGEDGDVIYIVDLENGGSAVMGADKRMEPIYAILDETKISPEKLTLTATRSDDGEQDIEEYVMGLMNAKIQSDAGTLAHPPIIIDTTVMPIIPIPQFWTDTVVIARQTPLLRTKWGQGAPFNNNYPLYSSGIGRYPACCVAIAVAQAMYYNRFPNNLGSVYFNWDLIYEYEIFQASPSSYATNEVANFIGCITDYLEPSIGVYEIFSHYDDAVRVLSNSGYNDVLCSSYSLSKVIDMVNNNSLPIILFAQDATNTNKAHSWLIDGCNVYKVEHWERNFQTQFTYTDTLESVDEYNLVHCNYGWDGSCDGYYTSGIFDIRERLPSDMIDTTVDDKVGNLNYQLTYDIKVITYNL